MKTQKLQIKKTKKHIEDKVSKFSFQFVSIAFSLIFIILIFFIVSASIPGFKQYGFLNIFISSVYDLNVNKVSIWLPLCITIITTFISIIVGAPIAIKTATFIKFRINKKYQKIARVSIELLADIPSVIFGLFAVQSLGIVVKAIFNLSTVYNLLTAGIMLSFMIIPYIRSITLSALDSIDENMLSSPIALGNSKTRAIYNIYKKGAKSSIFVGIIIAVSRAIGETMAVSMILQSQSYNAVFDQGFLAIFGSYLKTLGSLIATNMFAENGGEGLKGLLFIYGLFLFIFVIILNGIATKIIKNKKGKQSNKKIVQNFYNFVAFTPNKIKIILAKLFRKTGSKIKKYDDESLKQYYASSYKTNKKINAFFDTWKIFWEIFCSIILFVFILWIIGDITVNGISAMFSKDSSLFSIGADTTGQALINTILIIIVAIGITFPIALAIALYVNEYLNNDSKLKKILLFFFDSLGGTPSILFGMFGMIFFIQTLGLSSSGVTGKSLIAGIFTICIVILPNLIRNLQQALQVVSLETRLSSYSLGISKWKTIYKIVLPTCFQYIITSIVLTIGRILAETAPLYLTSGLGSSSHISLIGPGQTLTTRIYAQIYVNDYAKANNVMYECAFVTLLLILIIILIVHVLIPWYSDRKKTKTKKIKQINKNLINNSFETKIKTKINKLKFNLFNSINNLNFNF